MVKLLQLTVKRYGLLWWRTQILNLYFPIIELNLLSDHRRVWLVQREGRLKGFVPFKKEANLWLRGTQLPSSCLGWGKQDRWQTKKRTYRRSCWSMNVNNAFNIRSSGINCRVQSKASLVYSQVGASTINYVSLKIDFNLGRKRMSFIDQSRLPKIWFNSASTTEALQPYFVQYFILKSVKICTIRL